MVREIKRTEYKGTYKDKYRLDEDIPHVGTLADEYNSDGWEKVRLGYVEIFEEDGVKYARVTEKGRAPIAGIRIDIAKGDQHKQTQGQEKMGTTAYRNLIRTAITNIYGKDFEADLVDQTPNETRKPHKYTMYVRPRIETKANRGKFQMKLDGTLEEISNKLDDKMIGKAKTKVGNL
ncbi:MAG: hypothetical protein WC526_04530 [Patescibacteria group bacterium]